MAKKAKTIKEQLEVAEETMKYYPIEGTPFTIVELCQEKQFFGVLGSKRLTKFYHTKREAHDEVVTMNWDRIVQVIWSIMEQKELVNLEVVKEEVKPSKNQKQ